MDSNATTLTFTEAESITTRRINQWLQDLVAVDGITEVNGIGEFEVHDLAGQIIFDLLHCKIVGDSEKPSTKRKE